MYILELDNFYILETEKEGMLKTRYCYHSGMLSNLGEQTENTPEIRLLKEC
jgi:hypothetical protein